LKPGFGCITVTNHDDPDTCAVDDGVTFKTKDVIAGADQDPALAGEDLPANARAAGTFQAELVLISADA
jgi:hypothetical protein